MKPRPRQVDPNKAFVLIDTLEKFSQAEGQTHDLSQITAPIVTPDQLATTTVPQKSQKKADPVQEKGPSYPQSDYLRFMGPVYPNPNTYELLDADLKFVKDFNQKLKNQNVLTKEGQIARLEEDDLEKFLSLLDSRSGKHVVIEFQEFLNHSDPSLVLPKSIRDLDKTFLQELYSHWKKYRLDLNRTLLRSIMYPDSQDQNPHLAFRSRVAQNDRTMRLRKQTNTSQQKGLQEYGAVVLKVQTLKAEFNSAHQILKNILLREKATELDRRIQFALWEKVYQQAVQGQPLPLETKKFAPQCFLNGAKNDEEKYDILNQEAIAWKKSYERAQQEFEEQENNLKNLEQRFRQITLQHQTQSNNQFQEREEVQPPQPYRPNIARENNYKNKEYLEEHNYAVGKFLATCYLQARTYNLTYEKVMNETMTLSNFTPIHHRNNLNPVNNTNSNNLPEQAVVQPPVNARRQLIVNFMPLKHIKGNIIHRLKPNDEFLNIIPMKSFEGASLLQNKYTKFYEKAKYITENVNVDQWNDGPDDDRGDEEELRQARKKLKLNQPKPPQGVVNK